MGVRVHRKMEEQKVSSPKPSDSGDTRMVVSHSQVPAEVTRRRTTGTWQTAIVDTRSYIVEKELLESKMRKMQLENSTLHVENKLLKDKYNRATVHIHELENRLSALEEELERMQDNRATELSQAASHARAELDRELDLKQTKISALVRDNDRLQNEIHCLEQKLETALKEAEAVRKNFDRSKVLQAQNDETEALKTEIKQLQEMLSTTEQSLETACQKSSGLSQHLAQLTEMNSLLQLQLDARNSTGSVAERRVLPLEQRLRVTEERLTQERSDRASNLSQIEEKLLADNARLQASEKELQRQLQREKDKNRKLEQRSSEYREENMKLRLSLSDETTSFPYQKIYDIPNFSHSFQRQQTKKVNNVKVILKELEKEGVGEGEEAAITWLWNQCWQQQKQLGVWRVYLTDLQLPDKDTNQGLKLLREKLSEYEKKFKELETRMDDVQAEKITVDNTYKQQLSVLVKEKHESLSRLKTLEDLMDALRKENELLRQGLASMPTPSDSNEITFGTNAQLESLNAELQVLETRSSLLTRKNRAQQMELDTLRAQMKARDIALEEAYAEIKTAQCQRSESEESVTLRQKIESLTNEVNEVVRDNKELKQQLEKLQQDKQRLAAELAEIDRELKLTKSRQEAASVGIKTAKVIHLEEELAKKEEQILNLTHQLRQLEAEVDTTQCQLILERERTATLQVQVEESEAEMQQRGEIVEAITEKKCELLDHLTLVKAQLEATTLSCSQKESQNQVLKMELTHEKEKSTMLEERVSELHKAQTSEATNETDAIHSEIALELRLQEAAKQTAQLRTDLLNTTRQLGSVQEEVTLEDQENRKLKEELINADAINCQLTSQVATLKQDIETLGQDYSCVMEEEQQAEEHLVKMESRLLEVLHKFELEAKRQHAEFSTQYPELKPDDGPKILAELHTLRLLTREKDGEADMLSDKISRQQMQMRNLEKRVQMLQAVWACSREDVERLTKELVLKIKENGAMAALNHILTRQQISLQKENQTLQQDVREERSYRETHKAQIAEVFRKMEQTELSQKETSYVVQRKDNIIAELEAEVKKVKKNMIEMEVENGQLKAKVDQLREDIRNLVSVNSTMEKKLDMEKASLEEEHSNASKWHEDLAASNYRVEELKHEQNALLNSLGVERNNVQKLKENLQVCEETEKKLQVDIQLLTADIDMHRGQLLACRHQADQLREEKEAVFRDYQDACQQLLEKDCFLAEQQQQHEREQELAKIEVNRLIALQDTERGQLELDLAKTRAELNDLKDQLQQKKLQLASFGHTLQELEDANREKKELELKVERLESTAAECECSLESTRQELMALKDASAQLQETFEKNQMMEMNLQDQLRSTKETGDAQAMELHHVMEGMKALHEFEKKSLRETIQQLESNMKLTEADLRSSMEKEQSSLVEKCVLEQKLDDLNRQHSDEVAAHKLTQEKLNLLLSQLNDAKRNKFTSEEKMLELQASVTRLEAERNSTQKLKCELRDAEGAIVAKDAIIRGKQEQMEVLKNEVSKLQHVMESQKLQLTTRLQKSTLELKQQIESLDSERTKLARQAQHMSVELEQVREQLAVKSKENFKLQEQVVTLEDQMRDHAIKLHSTQVSLQQEEEIQAKLNTRYQEQEEQLRKLRTFLSRKAEEGGDAEPMWKEMNRMMQDLSQQLMKHVEGIRSSEQDCQDKGGKQILRLKRELHSLESQLNAEKMLHSITKSALQYLEEDCTRLRQLIRKMRHKGDSQNKKQKSHLEEINEIIAQSQTRAQAMMASGAYNMDGTFKHLNPSRDFSVPRAGSASGEASPNASLILSDASCSSVGLFSQSFLNLSGTIPPETPQK